MTPETENASQKLLPFNPSRKETPPLNPDIDLMQIASAMVGFRELTQILNFRTAARKCGLDLQPACQAMTPDDFIPENLADSVSRHFAWQIAFAKRPYGDLETTQADADALYENGTADVEMHVVISALIESGLGLFPISENKGKILTLSDHK